MKISEMTEEQVRDYALSLEQEKASTAQVMAEKDKTINELKDLTIGLQKRNNALFLQVEQQKSVTPTEDNEEEQADEVKGEEDYAREHFKEIIR